MQFRAKLFIYSKISEIADPSLEKLFTQRSLRITNLRVHGTLRITELGAICEAHYTKGLSCGRFVVRPARRHCSINPRRRDAHRVACKERDSFHSGDSFSSGNLSRKKRFLFFVDTLEGGPEEASHLCRGANNSNCLDMTAEVA